MNGLIQNQMQTEGGGLTPDAVRQQIQMPPELQEAYERVVLAGMQVLFSKQTNKKILEQLGNAEGPMPLRVGEGVAVILGQLFEQSNGTLPPQVLIPAGIDLVVQAADFLKKAKLYNMTDAEIGDAIEALVGGIIEMFGGNRQGFMDMLGGFERGAIEQAGPAMGAAGAGTAGPMAGPAEAAMPGMPPQM